MPIIAGVQARNSQTGAIRIGDEIAGENGKPQARKLDAFRLTSPSRLAVQEAAGLYGGEVTEWYPRAGTKWGKQFQVYTEVDEIPVGLPPGALAIDQNMELYGGGGLQRRCDGVTMIRPRLGPCQCPQAADCPFEDAGLEYAAGWAIMERKRLASGKNPQACKPKTRFSLLLPDISDFGVWVLRTNSEEAAAEVMAKAKILEMARASGVTLSARLAIEQRMLMVGGVLRQYPVPAFRLDDSIRTLASGELAARSLADQLPPAPGEARRAITAVPAVPQQKIPTAQDIANAAAKATTRAQIREMKAAAAEHRVERDMICPPGSDVYEELDSWLHTCWEDLDPADGHHG